MTVIGYKLGCFILQTIFVGQYEFCIGKELDKLFDVGFGRTIQLILGRLSTTLCMGFRILDWVNFLRFIDFISAIFVSVKDYSFQVFSS